MTRIGECIYCGKRPPDVELQDEHPVPFGLNGNIVVEQASCGDCAKITGRFEGTLQRDMLWPLRTLLEMKTRRKKDRPNTLPLSFTLPDGSEVEHQVPIDEYALLITLPELDRPTFFDNLPPSKNGKVRFHWLGQIGNVNAVLAKYGAVGVKWPAKMRPDSYARLIAKVAHSGAAHLGYYGQFVPVLTPLILGAEKDPWHWVGGEHAKIRKPPTPDLHIVDVKWQKIRGKEYLVAAVWLFANLGAPVHYAVVGPHARA